MGLEPISMMIKIAHLRYFGVIECYEMLIASTVAVDEIGQEVS